MGNHTPEPLQTPQRSGRNFSWVPMAVLSVVFFALGMLARPLLFSAPAIAEQLTPVQQRIEQLGAQLSEVQATLSQMRDVDFAALEASLNQMDKRLEHAESLLDELRQAGAAAEPQTPTVSADDDPMLGDPEAPVLIVEFSDYQCPFCRRFEVETMPQLIQAYVDTGKVRLTFRDFPLTQIHANALPAALASECADEQGSFWPYHDLLFARQSDWAQSNDIKTTLVQYAVELALDESAFSACLRENRYLEEVQHDFSEGVSYGITGTPSFFINGKKLVGAVPFSEFQSAIDAALAEE